MSWLDELFYGEGEPGKVKVRRRDFNKRVAEGAIKGAIAGAGVVAALDVGLNIYNQKSRNQMNLDPLLKEYSLIRGASEPIIKKAINERKIDVEIYDISFDSENPRKDAKEIEIYLQDIINTLDDKIKISIDYRHIKPYNPEVFYWRDNGKYQDIIDEEIKRDPRFKEKMDEKSKVVIKSIADELKDVVEYRKLTESSYYRDPTIAINSYLANYMRNDEEIEQLSKFDKVRILIADFEGGGASGKSKSSIGGNYILLSSKYFSTGKEYAIVMGHEIGHKINLPHTLSPDIMSYAPLKIWEGFGPESGKLWGKTKNHYKLN